MLGLGVEVVPKRGKFVPLRHIVTAFGEISSSVRKSGSGILTGMKDEETVDAVLIEWSLDWDWTMAVG